MCGQHIPSGVAPLGSPNAIDLHASGCRASRRDTLKTVFWGKNPGPGLRRAGLQTPQEVEQVLLRGITQIVEVRNDPVGLRRRRFPGSTPVGGSSSVGASSKPTTTTRVQLNRLHQ